MAVLPLELPPLVPNDNARHALAVVISHRGDKEASGAHDVLHGAHGAATASRFEVFADSPINAQQRDGGTVGVALNYSAQRFGYLGS
ncbi:hypothetical protein ABZS81_16655 [Streptomyces sp. NPDC005318]|uniref:hypothetical protein n=1 Tax=Streptomyces sp. NPDC005318 TaxID=3157031 RepID=UPI00339F2EC9